MASHIFWLHQDSSSKTHQIPILSLQLHFSVDKITQTLTLLFDGYSNFIRRFVVNFSLVSLN